MRPILLKYPKIPQFALTPRSNLQRAMTAVVIALASAAVALIAANVPPLDDAAIKIDDAVYDSFFKRRPPESQILGNIVIVTVDDGSIQKMSANLGLRFPWPRQCWGQLATYLQNCGARVVAFDLLFDQPSADDKEPDDKDVRRCGADQLSIPLVQSKKSGSTGQEWKSSGRRFQNRRRLAEWTSSKTCQCANTSRLSAMSRAWPCNVFALLAGRFRIGRMPPFGCIITGPTSAPTAGRRSNMCRPTKR